MHAAYFCSRVITDANWLVTDEGLFVNFSDLVTQGAPIGDLVSVSNDS